uniref:Retrotrans_gag domain-containing protein n=1 Tax=Strongyloides papillosus TaxID=174720 RepID=A0A0N5C4F7_STREA
MESFGNGFFNETASSGAVELKNVLKLEDYKGTSYTGYLKKLFTMRRIPKEDFPIQAIMQQNAERQSEMLECMSEDPTWEEIEQYVEEYCMINAKTWQSELVDVLKMEKQWGETPSEFFRRLERSAAMLIGRKDPKDVLLLFASRMPKSAHKYLLQVKDFSEASLIHAWTQSMEEKMLLISEGSREQLKETKDYLQTLSLSTTGAQNAALNLKDSHTAHIKEISSSAQERLEQAIQLEKEKCEKQRQNDLLEWKIRADEIEKD